MMRTVRRPAERRPRCERLVILLCGLGLWGCAPAPVPPLTSVIGRSEADVIRALGVPTSSYATHGGRVLVYRSETPGFDEMEPQAAPAGTYQPLGYDATRLSGPGVDTRLVARSCDTVFEIREGRVRSVRQSGAGCL